MYSSKKYHSQQHRQHHYLLFIFRGLLNESINKQKCFSIYSHTSSIHAKMSIDISEYRVGVIISLEDCGKCKGGGKSLRALKIRIGGADNDNFEESDLVTVVTSAPNVRLHSR